MEKIRNSINLNRFLISNVLLSAEEKSEWVCSLSKGQQIPAISRNSEALDCTPKELPCPKHFKNGCVFCIKGAQLKIQFFFLWLTLGREESREAEDRVNLRPHAVI